MLESPALAEVAAMVATSVNIDGGDRVTTREEMHPGSSGGVGHLCDSGADRAGALVENESESSVWSEIAY